MCSVVLSLVKCTKMDTYVLKLIMEALVGASLSFPSLFILEFAHEGNDEEAGLISVATYLPKCIPSGKYAQRKADIYLRRGSSLLMDVTMISCNDEEREMDKT